jgi:hypothetical protein
VPRFFPFSDIPRIPDARASPAAHCRGRGGYGGNATARLPTSRLDDCLRRGRWPQQDGDGEDGEDGETARRRDGKNGMARSGESATRCMQIPLRQRAGAVLVLCMLQPEY